jgi:hypothetical protein
LRPRDISAIVDGTAQDGRFPAALADHYFDVDERTLAELIAGSAEFAKSIHYYNLSNSRDESWRRLFASDEIAVMADIITTDSARMEAEFLRRIKDPVAAAEYLVGFAKRIDRWYQCLLDAEAKTGIMLSRQIKELIESKLRPALHDVAEFLARRGDVSKPGPPPEGMISGFLRRLGGRGPKAGADKSASAGDMFADFDEIWGFSARHRAEAARASTRLGHPHTDHPDTEHSHPEHPHRVHPHADDPMLRNTFFSLLSSVSYLQPIAADRLEQSLKSGDHNPSISLFVAFLQIFRKAQEKANLFTSRHRDFYYGDVLRVVPKAPIWDSTWLVVEATPGTKSLEIPFGTAFTAGKINGSELLYKTVSTLNVTDAQVRDLRTLHCPRDPQISPEAELRYVDSLRTSSIPVSAAEGAGESSSPLFGAEKRGSKTTGSADAQIGFAVASSALGLRDGDREIVAKISFRIPADTTFGGAKDPDVEFGERFRRLILTYPHATQGDIDDFKAEAKARKFVATDLLMQDPQYIFHVLGGSAFQLGITVASGWYAIPDYACSIPKTALASGLCQIHFNFKLGPEVPALSAWAAAVHGAGFDTRLPVLRFCLSPEAHVYAYSLFSDLMVEEIAIESRVFGSTRIVAWNQFGQLDPSKPFNPFGPLPTTSSYLVVGSYDCATMNLARLQLNLEWGDLPDIVGGFGEYYKGYGTAYSDDAFLAQISVLRDGRWQPTAEDDKVDAPLFGTDTETEKISNRQVIQFDVLRYFKRVDPNLREDQFHYDQRARSGFFRLLLAAPETAFGHRDYPMLLSGVLAKNAERKGWVTGKFGPHPAPLPSAPYTPVINAMSFDYTATSSVRAESGHAGGPLAETAYRIHAFGIETVDTRKSWPMLPPLDYDGNLYIGFSATNPAGVLTLFFHLREDSVTSISSSPEPVHWSYLAADEWRPFSSIQLLSDTTEGFLTSGIVTLDVPDTITLGNRVMPPNLYWLRVSAQQNLQSFCSLYKVSAQSVLATRQMTPEAPSMLAKALPAGSIRAPVRSIPKLRSVSQPLPSIGGRESETKTQTITRTSERLRHKARAVAPWDFERLVLEEFPEVFKVKCFSAMSSKTGLAPEPGSVLVVVVPHPSEDYSRGVFDPMLDAIKLKHIRSFLEDKAASSQIDLEVRNPAYERVMVRCVVRLNPGYVAQQGVWLKKLNQDLIDYISPWVKSGPTPRFGWVIQCDEVKAFIQSLAYVDAVTRFSMLHVTEDEQGLYKLDDTARPDFPVQGLGRGRPDGIAGKCILPRYPWSLAIPNRSNLVATEDAAPEVTGIGKLQIGDTFIVIR